MDSPAYRWHVALTAAGGLHTVLGGVVTILGVVILWFSDIEVPPFNGLVLVIGAPILALGVIEIAAGWAAEQALPADAPSRRPYVFATREALRGLVIGLAVPPVVGAAILPTWFAYQWVRKRGERKA